MLLLQALTDLDAIQFLYDNACEIDPKSNCQLRLILQDIMT